MGSPLRYRIVGKVHSREGIFRFPDIIVDVRSPVTLIHEEVADDLDLVFSHTDGYEFDTPTGPVPIRYYTYLLLTIDGVTILVKVKAYVLPMVVATTYPLLLGINWLKEVYDDHQYHRLLNQPGGYYETWERDVIKRCKKRGIVIEADLLRYPELLDEESDIEEELVVEEPTLVEPDIEGELEIEELALVELEIEEELVVEELAFLKPDIEVEPEIEKLVLEETKIEEEPVVKEVIQEDKLPELLVEDLTTEEHVTENQSKIEEPTLEIDNCDPPGDNLTIDHAIEDFVIQYSVVEDPAAKDLLIEGEVFQKVVMDVKVTTRGSDRYW